MEKIYWIGLHTTEGIGNKGFQALLSFFGSAKKAWFATADDLHRAGLNARGCTNLLQRQKTVHLPAILRSWKAKGIHCCTLLDAQYPENLKTIFDPPPVLYYRGKIPITTSCIAVVGSRRCSTAGRKAAMEMAEELAAAGVTVVSGAARGIDTAAHVGALKAGSTVAVLANGVDISYPPENKRLLDDIARHGAVISEYPPGTAPRPGMFPVRNRIISGLARGVLVVEAAQRSGALITADSALEQGRDVFAVPGGIFARQSQGTNGLLKQGAKLVDCVTDILEEYGWEKAPLRQATAAIPLSPNEKVVYQLVPNDPPLGIEDIAAQTAISVEQVSYLLLRLEMKGLVEQSAGHRYFRTKEVS